MMLNNLKAWIKLISIHMGYKEPQYGSLFGTDEEKYQELFKWLKKSFGTNGDILEFGVGTGGSTCLIAEYVKSRYASKTIHSFDSFTGFDADEFDENFALGYVTNLSEKYAWQIPEFSYRYVKKKVAAYGFDSLVSLHRGFFKDTLSDFLTSTGKTFSFALIDCDLASSVQFCANLIYPYISPGGVILFDDYASLEPNKSDTAYSPGVRKVVDRFITDHRPISHGYNNGLYHIVKTEE